MAFMGVDEFVLNVTETDVSTAGTVYVVAPADGKIVTIQSIIDGAIATANVVLTASIGSIAVTGGAITVTQSGSAAGDVDVVTPSALNYFKAGDYIKIVTGGQSTNTISAHYTIRCKSTTH
jgi:hypothetical protein